MQSEIACYSLMCFMVNAENCAIFFFSYLISANTPKSQCQNVPVKSSCLVRQGHVSINESYYTGMTAKNHNSSVFVS